MKMLTNKEFNYLSLEKQFEYILENINCVTNDNDELFRKFFIAKFCNTYREILDHMINNTPNKYYWNEDEINAILILFKLYDE